MVGDFTWRRFRAAEGISYDIESLVTFSVKRQCILNCIFGLASKTHLGDAPNQERRDLACFGAVERNSDAFKIFPASSSSIAQD